MMFPPIMTLVFGLAVTVALAVVDWYVWRSTPALPYPMAPTGPHFTEPEEEAFKRVA